MSNFSTKQPCVACGQVTENGNAFHHLYTQGARPDLKHETWNQIPVCLRHHQSFHNLGTSHMARAFNGVHVWLMGQGWQFDQFLSKWQHPGSFKLA